jgi:hypothetical protein
MTEEERARKVFKLLLAVQKVHRLCRELNFPELIGREQGRELTLAILEHGPEEARLAMLDAFTQTTTTTQ